MGEASRSQYGALRQGCSPRMRPDACLGELFRQKEACLLSGLPIDPGCALFWTPQKFATFVKAPQRKSNLALRPGGGTCRGEGMRCRESFTWSWSVKGQVTSAPLLSKASLKCRGGQLLGHRKMDQHLAIIQQTLNGSSTPCHRLLHLPCQEIFKKVHFRIFSPGGHHH